MHRTQSLALLIAFGVAAISVGQLATAQPVATAARRSPLRVPTPIQVVSDPGPGVIALDGAWQFHTGDDPSFATPSLDDSTGHDGWEQIAVDGPWGARGHRSYTGFAWYRKHLRIVPGSGTPGPGTPNQLALLVPHLESVYEIYWNGARIGGYGKMPPHPSWSYDDSDSPLDNPQSFGINAEGDGVLAVRVWFRPLWSYDNGLQGGLYAPPLIGAPAIITQSIAVIRYNALRTNFFRYLMQSLYCAVLVVSLVGWLRNRSQSTLLWMAVFCFGQVGNTAIALLAGDVSFHAGYFWVQLFLALRDIGLWFLLIWLLDLRENHRLLRFTRVVAWAALAVGFLDGLVTLPDLANHSLAVKMQIADAVLTLPFILDELYPLVLVVFAVRKRLDAPRWAVAICAFIAEMIQVSATVLHQGSRFTHWTISDSINASLFSLGGSPLNAASLASACLFIAIVYAVYRYALEAIERQQTVEQELKNARAVQQVLVPQVMPEVPGFALASVYRPAGEVGGDFFQILPVADGGVLAVIGDVSGKGMPAAMTVSLLVGTVRTLAHYTQSPAEILAAMNQRMLGRSNGGFTTCLVLRADADGTVTAASAGHLAPYLDGRELSLENGLPLGLSAQTLYAESRFTLGASSQLTLITDGVLEATDATTEELFGFERTCQISSLTAQSIAEQAQRFGQTDDITVLTLNRLALA
jgi:hypothetical protein